MLNLRLKLKFFKDLMGREDPVDLKFLYIFHNIGLINK